MIATVLALCLCCVGAAVVAFTNAWLSTSANLSCTGENPETATCLRPGFEFHVRFDSLQQSASQGSLRYQIHLLALFSVASFGQMRCTSAVS